MKKIFAAAIMTLSATANAGMITSTADSALTGATVETFDGLTQGYYASVNFAGGSVVGNGSPMRILNDSNASAYGISGNALQNYSGNPSSFDIIFDNSVSAFGIFGGAYNTSWLFQAFDSGNNLLEEHVVNPTCCAPTFYGIAADGIASARLSNNGADWVVFDDLYFVEGGGDGSVPVPAPVALMGLGLAGIAFSRRKKA